MMGLTRARKSAGKLQLVSEKHNFIEVEEYFMLLTTLCRSFRYINCVINDIYFETKK